MTTHAMLNNIAHRDLRVITRYGAQFGDNVASVPTFPSEYRDVQKEYPIFFRKDLSTGEYQSVALLGLQQNENLFLEEARWNARYVPGIVARGPFLIGFQEQNIGTELRKEPVIHLDLDSPRISRTEGEPIFLPHGGNSRYIEKIALILKGIHAGMQISKAMFAAFTSLGLIEPVNVEVKVSEEERYGLRGLHTISAEKLAALDDASVLKLHRAGFLQGAFFVIASLSNVERLIELHRHKRR